jgi:hypothetical protein
MFIPFLAASMLAAAFTHMGAMPLQIAVLTSVLNTLVALFIAIAAYMVWQRRKA